MADEADTEPVTVRRVGEHVALMTLRRPPHNYFDVPMVRLLADRYAEADDDPSVRVIVLAAEGRGFSAGANFGGDGERTAPIAAGGDDDNDDNGATALYAEAARVFAVGIPVVAAVHGIAIGGGFGLAVSADFRVAAPSSRFCANFARLGLHHGFGLTVSLPRVVGEQHALDMLLTGRRVHGIEAHRMGLVDRLVDDPEPGDDDGTGAAAVRAGALALAGELAEAAPLAVRSIRATQRAGLADAVAAATGREASEQRVLRATADFAEGVAAVAERRTPRFGGR